MRRKLLYLMHVDWNWIKQRPQYIEEELEREFDVKIICPRNYRLKEYHDKENIKVFYTIPFIRRIPGLWKIDLFRKKRLIYSIVKRFKPDVIYMTSPGFAECIPEYYKGRVVYDCMDDMLSFSNKKERIERVKSRELTAVTKADLILVSSERLKRLISERYSIDKDKLLLVRNGYNGVIADVSVPARKPLYTLCYFGTISHWFNFEFILKSLEEFNDIEYLLIGPVEGGTPIPSHERIIIKPPVKHDKLQEETKLADAFIMPFKINDLILSVDPVKLYEYINFGKNILCVEYPEIERFSPFVYFYSSYDSYVDQIKKLKSSDKVKYKNKERIEFLNMNSWQQRAESIVDALKG